MVMPRWNLVVLAQLIGDIFTRLLRVAVDDASLAPEPGLDEIGDLAEEVLALGPDFVLEVLAIERGGENDRRLHAKIVHHVLLDAIIRSRGERDQWNVGEILLEAAHLLVVGTKVVAPG